MILSIVNRSLMILKRPRDHYSRLLGSPQRQVICFGQLEVPGISTPTGDQRNVLHSLDSQQQIFLTSAVAIRKCWTVGLSPLLSVRLCFLYSSTKHQGNAPRRTLVRDHTKRPYADRLLNHRFVAERCSCRICFRILWIFSSKPSITPINSMTRWLTINYP